MHARAVIAALLGAAARAQIALPPEAPECVRWAAQELAPYAAKYRIDLRFSSELEAESFRIQKSAASLHVSAGDARGAMYALQELREQIESTGEASDSEQRPFLEFRADNPFIHVNPSNLRELEHWLPYIDMLARHRFNVLDLHGSYDLVATDFPNLYPRLLDVPGYPQAGIPYGGPEEQAKNLAAFRAIVAHAKRRCLDVAFMNYMAPAPGVSVDDLADYTAKAVAQFIREVPELDMLGFRVGESGQRADFFERAYLQGVRDSGRRDLRLYTRSWLTTQEQLERIAQVAPAGLDIEIKFNGEQAGLPYIGVQGYGHSYGYQGYLRKDAPYRVIWQYRANGTHRFWAWHDTAFIRQAVREFSFGNARGVSLESHHSYFPIHAATYYASPSDQGVHRYLWQKNWMWYHAWGRLLYDPDYPESRLRAAYRRQYADAGDAIYEAMQAAGRIVPLALSYRFMGADHREHSPETEPAIQSKRLDGRPDPLGFGQNTPMDTRAYVGVRDYVANRIAGRSDGRRGPFWVAAAFENAAAQTRAALAKVDSLPSSADGAWRLLRTDLQSAAALADYYAARTRGATHLEWALRQGSEADFARASELFAQSRSAWAQLAATADPVFAPLQNPQRKQENFKWAHALPALQSLDAMLPDLWRRATPNPAAPALTPGPWDAGQNTGIHVQAEHVIVGSSLLRIRVQLQGLAAFREVVLWKKRLPSEERWTSVAMSLQSDGSFVADLPLEPQGLIYQVEARDQGGAAQLFPVPPQRSYIAVMPWEFQ